MKMKWTYKVLFGLMALFFFTACEEERAFVAPSISAPSNVAATFNIATDNSGTITVVPTADGAVSFTIDFGDGSDPVETAMGTSASHAYAEGDFVMNITAKSVDGQTASMTQNITVRFTAPENMSMDVDVSARTVVITPSADGATLFEVYLGEVADETPTTVMPGESLTHIYAEAGIYTVRVVAKGAGAATTEVSQEIETFNLILFPLDFEANDVTFNFGNFGGASAILVDNPDVNDGNNTAKVIKFVKEVGGDTWGGVFIEVSENIDLNAFKKFKMKLWSPKENIKVILKLENLTNTDLFAEQTVTTTKSNEWENLLFDFSEADASLELARIVIFIDFDVAGDGTEFFFDDLEQTNEGVAGLGFPLDFESDEFPYNFGDFGNAFSSVVDNPDKSGINISAKVGQSLKSDGAEDWAGGSIKLSEPMDFANNKTITVKVWSPKAGATVKVKVENSGNPDINHEIDVVTTTSGAWEELSYDFSAIDATQDYDVFVIFFDFGNRGDGSTYYFDDVQFVSSEPVAPALPMNFEESNVAYAFGDFGNAFSSVVDNPDMSGINTSAKVGQSLKSDGSEDWAGGLVRLRSPMDFANNKTVKIKVWSPKAGATVKVKVENSDDGSISAEVDMVTTTSNAWEELSYDFSAIDATQTYATFVIFFDFGNRGDGSTYYFDDVRLEN